MTRAANLAEAAGSGFAGRNRIINGAMMIDQRNAGAAVTPTTDAYTVDRWSAGASVASKLTFQQASDAPSGFTNSLKVSVASAYTPSAPEWFGLFQRIEGYNCADLGFGTASAKPITVSFWVKSSIVGTYGGFVINAPGNRGYPFSYSIPVANTWTYCSLTIPGDVTGGWNTNNAAGITLGFSLGAGSAITFPAGSWGSILPLGTTGQTQFVTNAGATFYITGVQLEKGSTATPFENRLYGTELALCQRYCVNYNSATANGPYYRYFVGQNTTVANTEGTIVLPVQMRVLPSLTVTNTASNYGSYSSGTVRALTSVPVLGTDGCNNQTVNVYGTTSGLVAGYSGSILSNNNNVSYLLFTAEL